MEPNRKMSTSSIIMRKHMSSNLLTMQRRESSMSVLRRPSNIGVTSSKNVKKNLPENFFEQVLDLELKLKREFTMESLQSLVGLYTIAIEYYENSEDVSYKDYQNRLNLLLSNPEIMKKMNDINLKKRSSEPEKGQIDYTKKLMLEYEKKKIKMKVNYTIQVNNMSTHDEKVQQIISNADGENPNLVNSVLDEEISKQQDVFKSRLEEKRRKQSTSAIPRFNDQNKQKRYSMFLSKISGINLSDLVKSSSDTAKVASSQLEEISEKDENNLNRKKTISPTNKSKKSKKSQKVKSVSSNSDSESSDKTVNSDDSDSDDSDDGKEHEVHHVVIKNSLENFEQVKLKELEEMFSPIANIENSVSNAETPDNFNTEDKNRISDFSTTIFKINENLNESKHMGPKHYQTFFEIKETLDNFVNDFNFYFYEHVFSRFVEHSLKLVDEKYLKFIEITKIYHGQIKEMEFLITEDSEDEHKIGILNVIDSLKEERQHELDKIEDHYNRLLNEAQSSLKNFGFKNNPGIQLIEEKFKLDMYNLLNLILLPKK